MGNSNSTAKEGIVKLINNKPLIEKYLNKSVIYQNYMNNRCLKVMIPGDEIEQNSSFYIYNIEGFFDIEKGIYFSLAQIIGTLKVLEDNKIQIKDYEDFEIKVNTFLCAIQLMNSINNFSSQENVSEQKADTKCICTEVKEEKSNNNLNINFGSFFSFSWNKNEEKYFKQEIKMEEQEKIKKEINNFELSSIANYTSIILALIEILQKFIKVRNPRIKKAISWLQNLIPFNELKELVYFSIRAISGTISGVSNIIKGVANLPHNKFLSVMNLTTGILELGKVGVDAVITCKKIQNQRNNKKRTKAQDNFLSLLNQMESLFSELVDSNLEKLKKNNIIILGIDESNDSYNEGTDLKLFKIDNIENYAKCLSEYEENRVKYIQNMIYFYNKILPKFSQLTDNGENDKNESLDFLLCLQEFIINNCKNEDFWIETNKESIEQFIGIMEKEYENGKNYIKHNGNQIKKKIIASFEKGEEKNQIKKNRTLTICKSLSNIKDCEPPAPIINIKYDNLKTSRIDMKRNIGKNENHILKKSKRKRKNNEKNFMNKYKNEYSYNCSPNKVIKEY